MKKFAFLLVLMLLSACHTQKVSDNPIGKPTNLLVESKLRSLNVHNMRPKLSWHSNIKSQSHYQIQASLTDKFISRLLWDSGKVEAKHSLNIKYLGAALGTNDTVYWRVRVWQSGNNQAGQWSEPSVWEMGLLEKSDWKAQWIQVKKQVITPLTENVTKWVLYATGTHKEGLKKLPKKKAATQMLVVDQVNQQPTAGLFRHNFFIKPSKKIVKEAMANAGLLN